MTVHELVKLCYSRFECDVNITSNDKASGDVYKGVVAEIPYYILDIPIESWFCSRSGEMEIVLDET